MENNTSFKVTVQHKRSIELSASDLADLDIVHLGENRYHLVDDNKSLDVKVVELDGASKKMRLEIGGKLFEVEIEDQLDILIDRMGLNVRNQEQASELVAPMPGLIVDALVAVGDNVTKGDHLIVLEAMKMENVIKASGSAIIAAVEVEKGNAVDKGQVLIRFE